jgi:Zn-dependent protease with chaperone function
MRRMAMVWRRAFRLACIAVGCAVLVTAASVVPARAAGRSPGQIGSVLKKAQQFHDLEITDEDEQKIGAAVSEKIRQRYGVVQDPAIHKYVTLVGNVLAQHSERPQLAWKFIVLDTDGVNALAAPGGYVHITRGALSLMSNEAELAGVLGHEIIHVTEKHTIRAIQKGKAIQMGANETMANNPAIFNKIVDKATDAVMSGFGRGEELEADEKGIVVAAKAAYDPKGLGAFLTTLADRNKNSTGKQGLFASHPEMDERLKKLDKTIADQKLTGSAVLDARFHQNVTYKPVPLASVTTVEKGAAGLAGDSGKADDSNSKKDDKNSDEKAADDGKKKKGFGLSKLMGGGGSSSTEQKSAETTGSQAARGVDTERNAKGGSNPAMVTVKVTPAEVASFKKDGKLS